MIINRNILRSRWIRPIKNEGLRNEKSNFKINKEYSFLGMHKVVPMYEIVD